MISLFENIVKTAMLSSVLIIAVLILKKIFLHKINIRIISFLWALVLIRLIFPITFESSINISEILPRFAINEAITDKNIFTNYSANENATIDEKNTTGNVVFKEDINVNNTSSNVDKNLKETIPHIKEIKDNLNFNGLITISAYIWILGVLISLLIKTRAIYIFSRKISSSRSISDSDLLKMLNTNKFKLNIKRKVKVYECGYIDAPLTCGVFKPKILLPVGFISTLKKEQQNLIILHELYHIKNFDVAKNYLWLAAKIIYWFNPLINIAYKAYTQDVELLCDTSVINSFSDNNRKLYSQSLIDIIKLSKGEMKLPIALSFCEDKSILRKRVEYMIKPTKKLWSAGIFSLLTAVVLIFVCFTTACMPKANAIDEIMDHIAFEAQANKHVKLIVNADVIQPKESTAVIKSVAPLNISTEQLGKFMDFVLDEYSANTATYNGLNGENGNTYTRFKVAIDENEEIFIELMQTSSGRGSQLSYWRSDHVYWTSFDVYEGTPIKGMEKSYEECLKIAENLIKELTGEDNTFELGISQIYTNGNENPAYRFLFIKKFADIKNDNIRPLLVKNGLSCPQFLNYESIDITVDDEGVLEFWWSEPCKNTSITLEKVELLDFEIIKENFTNYCKNNFTWTPNEVLDTSAVIDVYKVELMNWLIYDESLNTYILTPVWTFIGDVTYDNPHYYGDHLLSGINCRSVVTINAIDGTVYE